MSRIRYIGRDYWFELLIAVMAIAGMLELPLFARRRFSFAAPASYWVIAAALTYVDGLLIPFIGSLGVVGLATAFLLGNLREERQAGIGLDRARMHRGRGRQHPRGADGQR